MYNPLKRSQKKTLFTGDASINWATGRRWQAKLLDNWQVTQIQLPRQESVKISFTFRKKNPKIFRTEPVTRQTDTEKAHEHHVPKRFCLLVGCLTSQYHASVSQGRICSDNFTCCHTDMEVADQTFHLIQSQYTDTRPTCPSTCTIMPGTW